MIRFPIGNKGGAYVAVIVFIIILCFLLFRCTKAQADEHVYLRAGSAFGPGGAGPVLGLDLRTPLGPQLDLYAGTLLWGKTKLGQDNWDWHVGVRTCRGNVCANLGAAYVQAIDALNGSHTNFNLGLSYQFSWHRLAGIDYAHLSNAGTIAPNLGRNAALVDLQLQ